MRLTLVGRSSSHFTRTARFFAHELGVEHDFQPVLDMTVLEPESYGENPALKVPILVDEQGPLYGSESICRELRSRSGRSTEVVMPGEVAARLVLNAQELVSCAMATEVSIITARAAGSTTTPAKPLRSIELSLGYLEQKLDRILNELPTGRAFSFLEVTLFCLVRHLPFREVMTTEGWPRLSAFCDLFGERAGARATEYRYDSAAQR